MRIELLDSLRHAEQWCHCKHRDAFAGIETSQSFRVVCNRWLFVVPDKIQGLTGPAFYRLLVCPDADIGSAARYVVYEHLANGTVYSASFLQLSDGTFRNRPGAGVENIS